MDARRAAAVLGACQWLRKQISLIENEAKPALEMQAGETKNAELPDGTVVGKVIMAAGRKTVTVDDWQGLAEWVAKRWPKRVVMSVDPKWWEGFRAEVSKRGAFIDDDGEVCPYVTVLHGDPYSMTKLDLDLADALFKNLLKGGGMSLDLDTAQLQLESPKTKRGKANG